MEDLVEAVGGPPIGDLLGVLVFELRGKLPERRHAVPVDAQDVLEQRPEVARRVAEFYDWLVYDEPQVADDAARLGASYCRTWRYYGSRPMVGQLAC